MNMIREKSAEFAAAAVAVILCLLFGSGWFTTWLYALVGVLNVPTALGVPAGLPGLRVWPLGGSDWWFTVTETIAALVLVALVFLWVNGTRVQHPASGALRALMSGWVATIVAAMAANVVRVVVTGFVSASSLSVYLGATGAALALALLWGLALGWLPALAAVIVTPAPPAKPVPPG